MANVEESIIAGLKKQVRRLRTEIKHLRGANLASSGAHLRALQERDDARRQRDEAEAELLAMHRKFNELEAVYKAELQTRPAPTEAKKLSDLLLQRDVLYDRVRKLERERCSLKAQVEQYGSLLHG